jgi:hypothetical protein
MTWLMKKFEEEEDWMRVMKPEWKIEWKKERKKEENAEELFTDQLDTEEGTVFIQDATANTRKGKITN